MTYILHLWLTKICIINIHFLCKYEIYSQKHILYASSYPTKYIFSLHMHAKLSFAHRLQTVKMASSRTSAQNDGPRAQKMALRCKIIALG